MTEEQGVPLRPAHWENEPRSGILHIPEGDPRRAALEEMARKEANHGYPHGLEWMKRNVIPPQEKKD